MRIKIIYAILFVVTAYFLVDFWRSFNGRFREVGLLKSRISYALEDDALQTFEKVSAPENRLGVRIFDLKIKDSCRLYVFDFPNPESSFVKPAMRRAEVVRDQLNYYSGLETASYNFSYNLDSDVFGTKVMKIEAGSINQIVEKDNSISFSATFRKLSLAKDEHRNDLIIESLHPSLQTNIFLGKYGDKAVLGILFTRSGQAIEMDLFNSIFH